IRTSSNSVTGSFMSQRGTHCKVNFLRLRSLTQQVRLVRPRSFNSVTHMRLRLLTTVMREPRIRGHNISFQTFQRRVHLSGSIRCPLKYFLLPPASPSINLRLPIRWVTVHAD